MSHITNVMLTASGPFDTNENFMKLQEWLLFGRIDDDDRRLARIDKAGDHGDAFLRRDMWAGAFNYLDLDEFIERARKLRNGVGDQMSNLQIFILKESEFKWMEVKL